MNGTFQNLTVSRITQSQHMGTCGYWFIVQDHYMAHTAFATLAGLLRWASQRGLEMPVDLPREGKHDDLADKTHVHCKIIGSYRAKMHGDEAAFDALPAHLETRDLSNGDYVEAKITVDPDGLRTVHTLNPNVRTRHTFDYTESRLLMS